MDDLKDTFICFCCLSERGQFRNMMEEEFIATHIKVKFVESYTACTGISPNNQHNTNICSTCEDKLKLSYEFRELCRSSYQTLTERFQTVAVDKPEVEVASDSETEFEVEPDALLENQPLEEVPPIVEAMNFDNFPQATEEQIKKSKRGPKKMFPEGTDVSKIHAAFTCYHCDLVLTNHTEFQEHREIHLVGKRNSSISRVCSICQVNVSDFVKHITECHKDYRPNVCGCCSQGRFQTASELMTHLSKHVNSERIHQCLSCHKRFKTLNILRCHVKNHRNPDFYICPFCGQEFAPFAECRDHCATEHGPSKKVYPCFTCKQTFIVRKRFDNHKCSKSKKNTDTGTKPSVRCKCDCGLLFSCNDERDCHQASGCLVDKGVSKCSICDKEFETRKKLIRHLTTHEPKRNPSPKPRQRRFICDTCGYATTSESHLKLHKFMHVAERPIQCQLCPATFKLHKRLKDHQRTHQPAEYTCYLCEKKFRTYNNIRLHMGTHSTAPALRRFACNLCGKTSVNGQALTRHMRTHTNEKKFKCGLCCCEYRDIGALNKHVQKVHEGWYYECVFCFKTYKEKLKFRDHLYNHRGFKPFSCPECPSEHVLKYIFIKHLKSQHNIDFVEKIHGYREQENIKALLAECLKKPSRTEEGQEDEHVGAAKRNVDKKVA